MRRFILWLTAKWVHFVTDWICVTYGDVASLSPGPCERCTGKLVISALPTKIEIDEIDPQNSCSFIDYESLKEIMARSGKDVEQ